MGCKPHFFDFSSPLYIAANVVFIIYVAAILLLMAFRILYFQRKIRRSRFLLKFWCFLATQNFNEWADDTIKEKA